MRHLDVRLYAAFAAGPGGGNVAGVVYDDGWLDAVAMQRIASDLGAPTTAFVRALPDGAFGVRFFSRTAEMAMCGHATIAAFASLAEDGRADRGAHRQVTAAGVLAVEVDRGADGVRVTMRQPSPRFDLVEVAPARVAPLLGLPPSDVKRTGSASTGLRHLLVEVAGTDALARIRPDDGAVRELCRGAGIDTVGVFALLDGSRAGAELRVRDLCHGVGDPEEAASGTTNGALAALLFRDGRIGAGTRAGTLVVRAEQGVEMGRPSLVTTELELSGERIEAVRVGGTAARRLEGRLLA